MFDIFNMLKKDEAKAVKQVTRETIIGDILDMDQSTAPYFMEVPQSHRGRPAPRPAGKGRTDAGICRMQRPR